MLILRVSARYSEAICVNGGQKSRRTAVAWSASSTPSADVATCRHHTEAVPMNVEKACEQAYLVVVREVLEHQKQY